MGQEPRREHRAHLRDREGDRPRTEAYFKKDLAAGQAIINPLQKKIEETMVTPEEKKLYGEVAEARRSVLEMLGVMNKLKADNDLEGANKLVDGPFSAGLAKYEKAVGALADYERAQIDGVAAAIEADHLGGRNVLIVLSLAALALGAFAAWRLTVGIVRPLGQAVSVAETVAAGDLGSRIEVQSRDETGQLLQALKEMNESLARVVGEVRTGTDTIATASSQIASGNQDLSSRTEEQASSLEETAASMEELTSTVKQNADNARQANQLAVSASEVAVKGGKVVCVIACVVIAGQRPKCGWL